MTSPARPRELVTDLHRGRTVLAGDLARRRSDPTTGPVRKEWAVIPPFSLGGALYISESSPYRSEARSFTGVQLDLTTAGTSTTTVSIKKNGVSQGTVGIASGVQSSIVGLVWSCAEDDRITVALTAIGTGAAGITVVLL